MSTISLDTTPAPSIPAKPTFQQKRSETSSEILSKKNDDDKKDNVTTSLSFDQVNDNADELVELRGEGRYFGVTDPSSGETINTQQSLGPLCANCHKRGHIRSKCKTVVCHKCGVVGDHYETQCPTTMICSRCGLKGHIASNCTNKQKKKEYCKSCDTFSHSDDRCPNIWRSYLTLSREESQQNETVLPVIYCYNCGDDTHYGDECDEPRSSRIPNQTGSAFSGSNLPRNLRDMYYQRIKQQQKRSRSSGGTYGGGYSNSNYNDNYGGGYNNGNNRNNNGYGHSNNNNNNFRNSSYSDSRNHNTNNHGGVPNFPRNGYNESRDYSAKDSKKRNNNNSSSSRDYSPTHDVNIRGRLKKDNKKSSLGSQSDGGIRKPSRSGVLSSKKAKKNGLVPSHTPFNSPYNASNGSAKLPQAPTRSGVLMSRKNNSSNNSKRASNGPNY